MSETVIRELKHAVLERWEDTKSNIVVGLSHQVFKLRKGLADKKYSSFDLSPSIPSIHTVHVLVVCRLWFCFSLIRGMRFLFLYL